MANNGNYLNLDSGKVTSDLAIESRSGGSDASKIIRTDSNGYIDNSFLNIGDAPVFDVYDAASAIQFISTTYTDVIFDTIRESDSSFSYSTITGEMTANVAGKFVVQIDIGIEQVGGNSRSEGRFKVQLDTGGGYADLAGAMGNIYSRQTSQGEGGVSITFVWNTNIGDKIRVQGQREDGGGTLQLRANSSRMVISGLQGPTGSQGPAGSSGSVGALGEVQYSDGIGGFLSSSNLSYGSDTLVTQAVSGNDAIDIRDSGGLTKFGMEGNYPVIADRLAHLGDTNTYISFSDDQIDFIAGVINFIRMDETTQDVITFNVNNNDVDFVIDKNTSGEALRYDAGLDTFVLNSPTSIIGGNLDVTNTGVPVGAYVYRTDGSALGIVAGSDNANLRFDNSDMFQFQAQSRADLEAQNGSTLTNIFDLSISTINMNPSNNDIDFIIHKLTSGQAYKYDAGLDEHTYNGRVSTNNILSTTSRVKQTITSSISETIDVSTTEVIEQTSSGITTTLSNQETGSQIKIVNCSTGNNTINHVIKGETVVATILPDETFELYWNGTEWSF
jgi:hypothetical protein